MQQLKNMEMGGERPLFATHDLQLENMNDTYSLYTGNEYKEIVRISRQNEFLNKFIKPFLDNIFLLCRKPVVLDIGCADGTNIKKRLLKRDYSLLLGIDKNINKIKLANELNEDLRNTFLQCDIETSKMKQLLSSYLREKERDHFDIIHISSVLLHVSDPQRLLSVLYEFLSPNGWIFIQDEDDGFNLVYPYDSSFEDCFYIWNHSNEAGDRHMGRKIPQMLLGSGYKDIKILSTTINSTDFNGEMKEHIWDIYFNSDLWVADNQTFYDNLDAYQRYNAYKQKHKDLREAYMQGKYFIMLGVFFITARKFQL